MKIKFKSFRIFPVLIFVVSLCSVAFSQDPLPDVGILNGKASNLVKPSYPAAAKAVAASGAVNVSVVVDENGAVIYANAVSGHPLLRQAAEQAASASKFAPTTMSGRRVKVMGTVVYNFDSGLPMTKSNTVSSSGSSGNQSSEKTPPEFTSGSFTSSDTEIYYEIYGAKTGTPLFVLHGGPGFDHQYFLSNSAFTELAKNRPVIFYDQRGTGKSAKLTGKQTATLQNQLEDLLQLTKYLGYEKIDLAGHSWGGFLAMTFASVFPQRISHLIIIDSMPENFDDYNNYEKFASVYPKEYEEMNQKRMEALFKSDSKAMRASVVAYMKMLFYSPQNRDRFIAGSESYTYNPDVNNSVSSSAEGIDLTDKLKELTVPTLILHGRHDANIRFESAQEIQQTIPKSQLVIFDQSGHMPFYEEPQKFVATVKEFLSK